MAKLKLDHLVLTVANFERTEAFYSAIGLRPERFTTADGAERRALVFGEGAAAQKFNLHQAGAEFEPKAARPTPGSADFCLICEEPLDALADRLRAAGLVIEEGPVNRTGAAGPIRSIYLRDPDGNLVELSNPRAG